jgi:hypothetical protein
MITVNGNIRRAFCTDTLQLLYNSLRRRSAVTFVYFLPELHAALYEVARYIYFKLR